MFIIKFALLFAGFVIGVKIFPTLLGLTLEFMVWYFSLPTLYGVLLLVAFILVILAIRMLLSKYKPKKQKSSKA